LKNIIIQVVRN